MTDGPIRTPSGVAMDLYAVQRDLTTNEAAYLAAYQRIISRTNIAKVHAQELFGRTAPATTAAIFLAVQEEKFDLLRALNAFDDTQSFTEIARRLSVI